ncbi:hypothetical protein B8W68_01055 [Mycobacterium paraintracellulare]|nr:hypothetical protein B8W68_01055 [Mycobacterium paraintracellulare]
MGLRGAASFVAAPGGVDGGDPLRPAPPRSRSPRVDGGDPLRPAPPRSRSPWGSAMLASDACRSA